MLSEYFIQLGVIIFPITVYQIWTFGKSFNQLPQRTLFLGLYGGVSAILCQAMPVHIRGDVENFQCVPIILSILYGKRKAGLISVALLMGYQAAVLHGPSVLLWNYAGILIYSLVPFLYCMRFDRHSQRKRFWISQLLSVGILIIELVFIVVSIPMMYGKEGWSLLGHYSVYLALACVIQLALMAALFFLLETIAENGWIRERQNSIIRYNPLGISVFDTENRFVAVNPAYEAITGYSESELVGNSRFQLWFPDQIGIAREIFRQDPRLAHQTAREVTLRHKSGRPVPVRFTLLPLMEDSRLVGYFAMVTDITETKAAEEMIRNSEKLKAIGQLAAGVAHEIRNPLTAVKGFLQLLAPASPPQQQKYYDIMNSEISRIEGIVSEMLVLSKPQAVLFKPVRLREKLEEVAALLEGQGNMHGIEIVKELGDGSPMVMADGNQLKQVFLNLGKNAIEAMPEGGRLRMALCEADDTAVVHFTDTGHGIPGDILDKIGEPFFTTKDKGTGLGLLTSKRIMADHQGAMKIRSTAGQGTAVELSLPLLT